METQPGRQFVTKASLGPLLPIALQDEIGYGLMRRLILDHLHPGAFSPGLRLHPLKHAVRKRARLKQGAVALPLKDGGEQPVLLTGRRPWRAKTEARHQHGLVLVLEEAFHAFSSAKMPHGQAQIQTGRTTADQEFPAFGIDYGEPTRRVHRKFDTHILKDTVGELARIGR